MFLSEVPLAFSRSEASSNLQWLNQKLSEPPPLSAELAFTTIKLN